MIFFGGRMLRAAVGELLRHYHRERNHQGLGNRLKGPGAQFDRSQSGIECHQRLGDMLRSGIWDNGCSDVAATIVSPP
jgi:hypothetical protein